MHRDTRVLFILLGLIGSGATFLFFATANFEPVTGATISVIARGGRVQELNLSPLAYRWKVLFGNLTESAGIAIDAEAFTVDLNSLGSEDFLHVNLPLSNCSSSEIYAAPQLVEYRAPTLTYMKALTAGTSAQVNSFMNISSVNMQSAAKVFNESKNFSIGGENEILETASLPGKNGSRWFMGVSRIRGTNNLVFVGNILQNGSTFNGSPTMFQLMLPVLHGQENNTYYFFQDRNDSCVLRAAVAEQDDDDNGNNTTIIIVGSQGRGGGPGAQAALSQAPQEERAPEQSFAPSFGIPFAANPRASSARESTNGNQAFSRPIISKYIGKDVVVHSLGAIIASPEKVLSQAMSVMVDAIATPETIIQESVLVASAILFTVLAAMLIFELVLI